MKSIFYKFLLGSALVATLASCTDEENNSSANGQVAVSVSAGITITRAVDNKWSKGDSIGITMLSAAGNKVIAPYTNYCYTTDGSGDFSSNPTDKRIYFPQDGSEVTFKSYYPYSGNHKDMTALPVDVAGQKNLSAIDLMTAEHISGSSKEDAHVKLHFYHRLAKIIVNLSTDGEDIISLAGCKLVIKGLKTTGSYNLMTETLSVNENSGADMAISLNNNSGRGIILPRAAGEGVIFEITTADGGVYSAIMNKELEIKGGYKHTFNIVLRKTPIEVSATIEDWLDGPTVTGNAISVSVPAGESTGVKEGDVMHVYTKENGSLTDFTYTKQETEGNITYNWIATTPVYWESIPEQSNTFYASIIAAERLHETQLPDILVADDTKVERNHGADLTFRHAASKIIVKLVSKDETFSTDELKKATVTLPDYLMGGKEEDGRFVAGTQKGIIHLAMTEGQPNGVAIIDPQTIAKGNKLAIVTLNGREYLVDIEKDVVYKSGEALELTLDMSKTLITVSAKVIDWTTKTEELKAITIGTPVSGGIGIEDKEVMHVYYGSDTERNLLTDFTYSKENNLWTAKTIRYWEELADKVDFYAYMERENTGVGLAKDYLVAKTSNVAASNGIAFEFSHVAAQVIITLNSATFTNLELEGAKIVLPSYLVYTTASKIENGVFVPATETKDLTVKEEGNKNNTALIPAQTIAANTLIAQIIINGRTYNVKSDKAVEYKAGQSTTLSITLEKTAVTVKATVKAWKEEKISLIATPITITNVGSNTDFTAGNKIGLYILGTPDKTTTFTLDSNASKWNIDTPIYWNDFSNDNAINVAAYSTQANDLSAIGTIGSDRTFTWNTTGDTQKGVDLLLVNKNVTFAHDISLEFKHALSKVKIKLVAGTGFKDNDLKDAIVTLNDIIVSGTASLNTATITTAVSDTKASPQLTKIANELTWWGYAIPQTILSEETSSRGLITVRLNNRDYTGTLTLNDITSSHSSFAFDAGKEPVITITLNKTGITLSATVKAWENGPTGDIIIK